MASDGTVFRVTRPEVPLTPGQGTLAAVRPECFRLDLTDPGTTVNVLRGTVASIAHFGDALQYIVHAAEREIVVLVPRAQAIGLSVGDDVWASWSADDVYQFSDDQSAIVLTDPTNQ